jgi:hypothetical protein
MTLLIAIIALAVLAFITAAVLIATVIFLTGVVWFFRIWKVEDGPGA